MSPSLPHLHHPAISRRLRQPIALSLASIVLPVRRSPPYGIAWAAHILRNQYASQDIPRHGQMTERKYRWPDLPWNYHDCHDKQWWKEKVSRQSGIVNRNPHHIRFLAGRGPVKIKPCLGLSHELLDIISSISNQARLRLHQQKHHPKETTQVTASMAFSPTWKKQTQPDAHATNLMNLHSKAFQSATWIYLHYALGDALHESRESQPLTCLSS